MQTVWRAFLFLLVVATAARAQPPTHARIEQLSLSYELNADLTYVETIAIDTHVLTQRGLRDHERARWTFYPETQSLELVEAWVQQPDGSRVPVDAGGRFTRPSEAAASAPGFSGAMTTTVLFPQMREGSRTHVVWRLTQKKPALLGFNVEAEPPLEIPVTEANIRITAPTGVPLRWFARGGFEVTDRTEDGIRRIAARIAQTQAEDPERNSVATAEFQPLFLATSLDSLAQIGAIYHRQSAARAVVTPEIAALAAKVAKGRTGMDAARAVYDWVAGSIRYVAVYLDPNDGWVPHPAGEVLARGYGDCKDHVVLMQAMLAALGIRAEAALLDQGNRITDPPLPVPWMNHAIVYLPDYDRFVNPTNPYARFDTLGARLSDKVVVLAREGGAVSRTPAARPEDNPYRYAARLALAEDGTLVGTANVAPASDMESAARAAIAQSATPQDLAERLLGATPEGGFGEFHADNPRDLSAPFTLTAAWRSPHAVVMEGRHAYLTVPVGPDLNPIVSLRKLLEPKGYRRHALMAAPGDYQWRYTIALPRSLAVERLPDDAYLSNGAGRFEAHYTRSGTELRVERRLVLGQTVYAPGDYRELETLIYAALDDARAPVTLLRTEALSSVMP